MEHQQRTDDTSKIHDAVIAILTSAISDLKKGAAAKSEGETRLLFPEGINFISLSVTLSPNKVDAHAELVISSKPVGKPAVASETESGNEAAG